MKQKNFEVKQDIFAIQKNSTVKIDQIWLYSQVKQ